MNRQERKAKREAEKQAAMYRTTFRLMRGVPPDGESVEKALAIAQWTLSSYRDKYLENGRKLLDVDEAVELRAASRALDDLSILTADADDDTSTSIALLAALAYGAQGDFISAGAVFDRVHTRLHNLDLAEYFAWAAALPHKLIELNRYGETEVAQSAFITSYRRFLRTGRIEDYATARGAYNAVAESCPEPFSTAVLRYGALSLEQVWHCSSKRVLNGCQDRLPVDTSDNAGFLRDYRAMQNRRGS